MNLMYQELEIEPAHVMAEVRWTLLAPLCRLVGRRIGQKHPLVDHLDKSEKSDKRGGNAIDSNTGGTSSSRGVHQVDFWGPCFFVSVYVALLWLMRVKHVSWVYLIWTLAAAFNHLVARVWSSTSALSLHLSVLGYSILPVVLSSCLLLGINALVLGLGLDVVSSPLLATVVQLLAAVYAAFAALLAYINIFPLPEESKHRYCTT